MEVYDVGFPEGRQFGDVEACIGYGDSKEILPAEEISRPDNQSFPEESAFLLPVFAYRDHLFRLAFLVQDEHLHVCSRCMERFHQASGGNGGSACFLGRIDYKYSHVAECFGKSTAFTAFYPQIRGFFSQ